MSIKKNVKKDVRKINLSIKWFLSRFLISFVDVDKLYTHNTLTEEELKKTLILVPHADDEWIGCSQVLKKSGDKTVYYFNFLGKNYSKVNEKIRQKELKSLQEVLGFELIISSNKENYEDLEKLISENNFSSIFIPSPIDWHPEHILVNNIFMKIYEKFKDRNIPLYFYKVSVPIPSMVEKKILPMTKQEIEEKKKIFLTHYPSQRNVSIRRLTLQNILSANRSEYYAVEPYAIMDFGIWKKLLNYINSNYKKEFQPLVHIIDSPLKTRKASNRIYYNFFKKHIS